MLTSVIRIVMIVIIMLSAQTPAEVVHVDVKMVAVVMVNNVWVRNSRELIVFINEEKETSKMCLRYRSSVHKVIHRQLVYMYHFSSPAR